MEVCKKE